jgi:hypothetical protein
MQTQLGMLISGALANKPFDGGSIWSRLGSISDLRRLGLEVCFVEQISVVCCVDAAGAVTDLANSINVACFCAVMGQFGLTESSAPADAQCSA